MSSVRGSRHSLLFRVLPPDRPGGVRSDDFDVVLGGSGAPGRTRVPILGPAVGVAFFLIAAVLTIGVLGGRCCRPASIWMAPQFGSGMGARKHRGHPAQTHRLDHAGQLFAVGGPGS